MRVEERREGAGAPVDVGPGIVALTERAVEPAEVVHEEEQPHAIGDGVVHAEAQAVTGRARLVHDVAGRTA